MSARSREREALRTGGLGLCPGHDLEVQEVEIVKELLSVPPAENEHLRPSHKRGAVPQSGRG